MTSIIKYPVASFEVVCNADDDKQKIPLTVILHNTGEDRRIERVLQAKYKGIFLTVIKNEKQWDSLEFYKAVDEKIHELEKLYATKIDKYRIYLTAEETAATGVWVLLAKYPRLFAAAIPIGGCGNPYEIRTVKMPHVWAMHRKNSTIGENRGTVIEGVHYLAGARYMVKSMRGKGNMNARYSTLDENEKVEEIYSDEVIKWLLSQTRTTQIDVELIRPGLYHLDDYYYSSSYLVIGPEKALLIDAGIGTGDIYTTVHKLTDKSIELAITHAHGDHYGEAAKFDKVYMHEDDVKTLPAQYERFRLRHGDLGFDPRIPEENIAAVREGDRIDIGGGIGFDVIVCPGHTIGSVAYASKELGLVFTGDLMGSGELVILSGKPEDYHKEVKKYKENLTRFGEAVKQYGDDAVYYGGHILQDASCDEMEMERVTAGDVTYYNPVCIDIVYDMIKVCDGILDGTLQPHTEYVSNTAEWHTYTNKAKIVYRPLSK